MKSLIEHNEEIAGRGEAGMQSIRRAGVLCPECGRELAENGSVIIRNPDRINVYCECGYSGYKLL